MTQISLKLVDSSSNFTVIPWGQGLVMHDHVDLGLFINDELINTYNYKQQLSVTTIGIIEHALATTFEYGKMARSREIAKIIGTHNG
jgi:hypothetical protein